MISSKALAQAIAHGNKGVIICGNGGSMSQASHMATETIGLGYAALALSDPATLSALANDGSYEGVFAEYLKPFGSFFRYFVGLTTSGSPNVLQAAGLASSFGMKTTLVTADWILTPAIIDLHVKFEGNTQQVQESTLEWIHDYYEQLRTEKPRAESKQEFLYGDKRYVDRTRASLLRNS